jgi:hypothetical protein
MADPSTVGKHVLIATPGFASLGLVTLDYVVPAPFLFPGGGTLNYAGIGARWPVTDPRTFRRGTGNARGRVFTVPCS